MENIWSIGPFIRYWLISHRIQAGFDTGLKLVPACIRVPGTTVENMLFLEFHFSTTPRFTFRHLLRFELIGGCIFAIFACLHRGIQHEKDIFQTLPTLINRGSPHFGQNFIGWRGWWFDPCACVLQLQVFAKRSVKSANIRPYGIAAGNFVQFPYVAVNQPLTTSRKNLNQKAVYQCSSAVGLSCIFSFTTYSRSIIVEMVGA